MAPLGKLDRNIRPSRQQESEEEPNFSAKDAESAESDAQSASESQGEDDRSEEEVDDAEDGVEEDPEQMLSKVSFGALKHAQDGLSKKRKRGSNETPDQEGKLEALRERLRELRERKGVASSKAQDEKLRLGKGNGSKKAGNQEEDDYENGSDSDSAPSEEGAPTARSKHAPMAQSSRHQVSRKRQVIDLPNRKIRDPRFDALQQRHGHPGDNSEKAYSFLRDYQASEIQELKAALKSTKDEDEKETLKRTIGSMENRLRAKAAKEREQEVLRQHRREEKQKVEQGKTPYYLKRSELKERTQVERFKGMKGKEREKAIDRKRKKEDQREKRKMPTARRTAR